MGFGVVRSQSTACNDHPLVVPAYLLWTALQRRPESVKVITSWQTDWLLPTSERMRGQLKVDSLGRCSYLQGRHHWSHRLRSGSIPAAANVIISCSPGKLNRAGLEPNVVDMFVPHDGLCGSANPAVIFVPSCPLDGLTFVLPCLVTQMVNVADVEQAALDHPARC